MRGIILFLTLLFISCNTDNCDLSEYPSSPLSEPYAVQYGDDWVEYTYVCVDGYNEIWTYRIEQGVGKLIVILNGILDVIRLIYPQFFLKF